MTAPMSEREELLPKDLPANTIAAVVGGGVTSDQVKNIWGLIRSALLLRDMTGSSLTGVYDPAALRAPAQGAQQPAWVQAADLALKSYEADYGEPLEDMHELGRIEESRGSSSFRIRVGHIRDIVAAALRAPEADKGEVVAFKSKAAIKNEDLKGVWGVKAYFSHPIDDVSPAADAGIAAPKDYGSDVENLARDMQSRVSGQHRGALLYDGYERIAKRLIDHGADGILKLMVAAPPAASAEAVREALEEAREYSRNLFRSKALREREHYSLVAIIDKAEAALAAPVAGADAGMRAALTDEQLLKAWTKRTGRTMKPGREREAMLADARWAVATALSIPPAAGSDAEMRERAAVLAEQDRRTELAKDVGFEPEFYKTGKRIAAAIRALPLSTEAGTPIPHDPQGVISERQVATPPERDSEMPGRRPRGSIGCMREALEAIALLDEADGHELTRQDALQAVAIATNALGKHPSMVFAEKANETRGGAGDDCSVGKRGVWPPLGGASSSRVRTSGIPDETAGRDRQPISESLADGDGASIASNGGVNDEPTVVTAGETATTSEVTSTERGTTTGGA